MVAADESGVRRVLRRVPLPIRMFFYSASFLAGILAGLPWLAYRLDVHCPQWHFEMGGWRAVGVGLFVIAFGTYLWASVVLTRRGRGAYVEFDPPTEFVATGLYRYMRNPVAAALLATILGEAIAFSSTGILLLFCIGLPLAHVQVVLLEEPLLRRRFGAAYEDYCRRVPRWIPRRPAEGG